jgi:hypothetical protein
MSLHRWPNIDQEDAMRKLIALVASSVFVLVTAVAVQAHEGHTHKMMGTVKAVHTDMNHVELTTAGGKTSGFYVNRDTKFLRGTTPAALTDLTPGTKVVVAGKMDGDKMVATSVKLSTAAKKTAAAAPHKH